MLQRFARVLAMSAIAPALLVGAFARGDVVDGCARSAIDAPLTVWLGLRFGGTCVAASLGALGLTLVLYLGPLVAMDRDDWRELRAELVEYYSSASAAWLREWVWTSSKMGMAEYAERMREITVWADEIECAATAAMLGVVIHVFLKKADGAFELYRVYPEAARAQEADLGGRNVVQLLFSNGNHYQLLSGGVLRAIPEGPSQ